MIAHGKEYYPTLFPDILGLFQPESKRGKEIYFADSQPLDSFAYPKNVLRNGQKNTESQCYDSLA